MWVPCTLFYTYFENSDLDIPHFHLFNNIECFYQNVRLMKDPVFCHRYCKDIIYCKNGVLSSSAATFANKSLMVTILFQVFPMPMNTNQIR